MPSMLVGCGLQLRTTIPRPVLRSALREACQVVLTAIEAIDPVCATMVEELRLKVDVGRGLDPRDDAPRDFLTRAVRADLAWRLAFALGTALRMMVVADMLISGEEISLNIGAKFGF